MADTASDLVEFLRARITEDEQVALAAQGDPRQDVSTLGFLQGSALSEGDRIVAHPARVLAECDAKRKIIEEHRREPVIMAAGCARCGTTESSQLTACVTCNAFADEEPSSCETLRLLALPYADHPDYRDEWRP